MFDALHAGGHIAIHGSEVQRRDALADHLAAARLDGGGTATVVVDTREHAATLNAAIRDRLVAAGAVDDRRVAVTHDGQRLGAGDVIVTRRNDHDLGVANRETWTVTRVHPRPAGSPSTTPGGAGASCPPTTSADTSSSATRSPATARKATPPPRRTSC